MSLLEREIELPAVQFAVSRSIMCKKLMLSSERGWPDRTFLYRGKVMFIEFKAPGEKPDPLQMFTINNLRSQGFEVHICDNLDQAKIIIQEFKYNADRNQ